MSYKKHGAGYLSIGEALKLGLAIAAISAIVNILYGFLFNYVIDPEYNQKVMDFSIDLIANSDAPVEQKEMQRNVLEFFKNPFNASAFWLGMSLFFGLIYSLIGGLVLKKTDDAY